MHELAFPLLVGLVLLALAFDFLNGLHDAANSIATVVATKLLRPVQAVAFAAFFNFAAYFLILWIPQLHKVADTIGKGLIDKDMVYARGGVRRSGRCDVLERRHLAQGDPIVVEPCAGRRDRRCRGCRGGVWNHPVERPHENPAVHSTRPVDRDGGGAAGDAHFQLACRDGPARAARNASVPLVASRFVGRLFARPRPQRRPEDDGDHHRIALFDRLFVRRISRSPLGRNQLLYRDRARHVDGRLEDHRDDGQQDHQIVPASGVCGVDRRLDHAVRCELGWGSPFRRRTPLPARSLAPEWPGARRRCDGVSPRA